jgi:formate dehydrogenase major subunit
MTIETERAEIEARALVTDRMRPLRVDGSLVHQVGLPWHWGYSSFYAGDSTNDLGALSGDPNVSIQESKAFTCNVRAGRRLGPSTARLEGARRPGATVAPSDDDPLAENPKETSS